MEDNEFVKIIQKERPETTPTEKVINVFKALKHIVWDRWFNREEYERIELARNYLKVYNLFYPMYKQAQEIQYSDK